MQNRKQCESETNGVLFVISERFLIVIGPRCTFRRHLHFFFEQFTLEKFQQFEADTFDAIPQRKVNSIKMIMFILTFYYYRSVTKCRAVNEWMKAF